MRKVAVELAATIAGLVVGFAALGTIVPAAPVGTGVDVALSAVR